MRQRIILASLASLALGVVLTLAFMAQMTWKNYGDCANAQNQVLPANIIRVDCSGLAYGFPYKFIQSKPSLDISYLTEQNTSPSMLGVTSSTEIDKSKLVLNVLFWSTTSGVVIGATLYKLYSRESKEDVSKDKK